VYIKGVSRKKTKNVGENRYGNRKAMETKPCPRSQLKGFSQNLREEVLTGSIRALLQLKIKRKRSFT